MTQKFTAEEVRENIAANRRHMTTETELQLTAYADTLSKPASPAEGDGGAAPDDDLPGMWSNADFTGGDPDERCHAARVSEDEQFNAFRLAYYGANKSLAPELESFRRAYKAIAPPAPPAVVPEGYVLVPREPTLDMQAAHQIHGDTSDWWNAVIEAAAPFAPEGDGGATNV